MRFLRLAFATLATDVMVGVNLFLMFSRLLGESGLLSLPSRFFRLQAFNLVFERLEFSWIDAIILQSVSWHK